MPRRCNFPEAAPPPRGAGAARMRLQFPGSAETPCREYFSHTQRSAAARAARTVRGSQQRRHAGM